MDPVSQDKPVPSAPAMGMTPLPAAGPMRESCGADRADHRRPSNPLLDTVCNEPVSTSQLLRALEEKNQALDARQAELAAWEAELARREQQVKQEEQTLLTLRVEVTKRQADVVLREARLKEASEQPPVRPAGLPAKVVIRDIEVRESDGPHKSESTSANALLDDFAGSRHSAVPAAPPAPPKTSVYRVAPPALSEVSVLMADHLKQSRPE